MLELVGARDLLKHVWCLVAMFFIAAASLTGGDVVFNYATDSGPVVQSGH